MLASGTNDGGAGRVVVCAVLCGLGALGHMLVFGPVVFPLTSETVDTVEPPRLMLWRFELAEWGIVWFAIVGAITLASLTEPAPIQQRLKWYIFVLSIPALAGVLIGVTRTARFWDLLVVQGLVAGLTVVAIFLVAGRDPRSNRPARWRDALQPAAVVAGRPATWFLAAVTVTFFLAQPATTLPPDDFELSYPRRPRLAVPIPRAGAAVQIVKFIDYECDPCRRTALEYAPIIDKVSREHPVGAIQLVVADYPLEKECNDHYDRDLHPSAGEAAASVRMARTTGSADAMERWLWENQRSLSPNAIFNAVSEIAGVREPRSQYAEVVTAIRADVGVARALGVSGTPTFFINGRRLGYVSARKFEFALRHELEVAGMTSVGPE